MKKIKREEWEVRITDVEDPDVSVRALLLDNDGVTHFVSKALENGWTPDQIEVIHRTGFFRVDHECVMEGNLEIPAAPVLPPFTGKPN